MMTRGISFISEPGNSQASLVNANYLGVNGAVALGSNPQIYLWGDKDFFPLNLAGAYPGLVPLVLEVDLRSPPSSVFTVQGTVTTAVDDPFGQLAAPQPGTAVSPPISYIYHGTDPTDPGTSHGSLAGFSPAGGLFISFWYKQNGIDTVSPDTILGSLAFRGRLATVGFPTYDLKIKPFGVDLAVFYDDTAASIEFNASSIPSNAFDGKWHNVMFSFDSTTFTGGTGSPQAYFDDVVLPLSTIDNWDGSTFDMSNWAFSITSNNYPVGLAEVFFQTGTPIDLSDDTVRAAFVDDNGFAVELGANGNVPFLPTPPQIYLSGHTDRFARNLAQWSFTPITATDTIPSSQFAYLGSVVNGIDDPFPAAGTVVASLASLHSRLSISLGVA